MILLWDKTDQSPVANAQQAEHYIQRKTMQAFIHARRQIEDSIGYQYGWKSAQWFVVYMLLNLWLYKAGGDGALYTDAQLNAAIYRLLTALHIPVRSPGGWNLGYLLSLIINLYIFVAAVKNEHAFWVYRIIKLRWYQHLKIVLCKLFLLAVALMELLVFYVVPAMTADQKKCGWCPKMYAASNKSVVDIEKSDGKCLNVIEHLLGKTAGFAYRAAYPLA